MFLGEKEIAGVYLGDKEMSGIFLGDKENWTGKVRLKYVVYCYFDANASETIRASVKVYNYETNELLKSTTVTSNSYNDGCISVVYQSLCNYRHTFTPLVAGSTSANGAYNYGHDYGGKPEQICPYVIDGATTTITFITTDKYKA